MAGRTPREKQGARVLIVDDDCAVRSSHARLIETLGYDVETAADGIEALGKLEVGVDLVLLDEEMPRMDGFEVARRVREDERYSTLPIIMVTGLSGPALHRRAIEVGINDFLNKPMHLDELELRSRWLLEFKRAHDALDQRNADLQRSIDQRTDSLRAALDRWADAERHLYDAHLDTIRRLATAAEFKDADTGGHIERVGLYSERLAHAIGLSPGDAVLIRHAALMHDVGKIGIPDAVLLKPGKLEPSEWEVMRAHTTLGGELLSGSDSPVMQMGERIARSHHERWDGGGYPGGLAGDDIPIEARICAVADYFDATTMNRPYRPSFTIERVVELMQTEGQGHFDPRVLDAFLSDVDGFVEIRASVRPD